MLKDNVNIDIKEVIRKTSNILPWMTNPLSTKIMSTNDVLIALMTSAAAILPP